MDKPKFNFLDGLIALLVVAMLVAGVYILKGRDSGSVTPDKNAVAEIQVQFTRVDESIYHKFCEMANNNESVWVGIKERFEGKVSNVTIEKSKKLTSDIYTGKVVMAENPSTNDVTVTIKADVVETESAIAAGGAQIRVGEETAVRGKGAAGFGFVVGIKTVSE